MTPTGVMWRSIRVARGANLLDDEPDGDAPLRVLGAGRLGKELQQLAVEVEPGPARAVSRLFEAERVAVEAPLALEVVTDDTDPDRPTSCRVGAGAEAPSL